MNLCNSGTRALRELLKNPRPTCFRRGLWTPSPELTASVTVESVKQEFKGIGGGYVFLNTSDLETHGIARLCFGNPYRKNAIRE